MTPTSRWCLGHFRLCGHWQSVETEASSAAGRSSSFLTLNRRHGSLRWQRIFWGIKNKNTVKKSRYDRSFEGSFLLHHSANWRVGNANYSYRLGWTSEAVLDSSSLVHIVSLALDQVGDGVLGAAAMHDLLGGVVGVGDQSPAYVLEKLAAFQALHRLASLEKGERRIKMYK